MRYRNVALGVGVFIFLIQFSFSVFAACAANDIFLKSNAENAHGATCSSGSSYSFPVSWGSNQLSSCNPPGNPTNVVIRLSADNNAHAELPTGTTSGYQDVCFGNLQCGTAPSPGYVCVYSLSDATNAHIGSCGFYVNNVYCFGAGPPLCNNNGSCDPGENNANCPGDCPGAGTCPDPDADITAPPATAGCDVFGVTGDINFSQQQAKDDTCFDYLWNFGDGVTFTTWNATHQYGGTGQRTVALTVTRKNDGKVSRDEQQILIVDGRKDFVPQGTNFVCARISDPREGDIFNTSQYVLFSGNKSFAVEKYNNGNDKLKCKAGPCPDCVLNPDGSGASSCSGSDNDILDIDNVKTNLDNDNGWQALNFLWEFGDGSRYYNLSINGSIYNKLFASPGTYLNKLTVLSAADSSVNGTDSVTIGVELAPGCYNNKKLFVDNLGNEFPTNTDTNGDGISDFAQCGGLDGDPAITGDNCCAGSGGWRCYGSDPADTDPVKRNHCAKDLPPGFCSGIFSCSNYSAQATCEADECGVRDNGGFVAPDGWVIVEGSCRCLWNSTTSICASRCNINQSYPKKGSPGVGDCIKTYTQGPCVSGQFLLSWIASLAGINDPGGVIAGALGCTADSKTYSCGRIAKLAFFTLKNVIAVIILLAAFYLIMNRKKIHKRFAKT